MLNNKGKYTSFRLMILCAVLAIGFTSQAAAMQTEYIENEAVVPETHDGDTESVEAIALNLEKVKANLEAEKQAQAEAEAKRQAEEAAARAAQEEARRQAEEAAAREAEEEARRQAEEAAAQDRQEAAQASQAAQFAGQYDEALLASIIFCEAGNQSYEGQVAVGAVVMNRINSDSYPGTMEEVIYQSGQFGPAVTGWLDSVRASGGYTDSALQAARDAIAGANPIGECLYFDQGGYGMQIGDHYFH